MQSLRCDQSLAFAISKALTWLCDFHRSAGDALPVQAHAAKQKTPRKEAPKGKANPVTVPVRKVTNIPTQRTLLSLPFLNPSIHSKA